MEKEKKVIDLDGTIEDSNEGSVEESNSSLNTSDNDFNQQAVFFEGIDEYKTIIPQIVAELEKLVDEGLLLSDVATELLKDIQRNTFVNKVKIILPDK